MSKRSDKSSINQWRYRKKLEKFNLKIQKFGQKKDIEERKELPI